VAFGDLHYGHNKLITPEGRLVTTPVHEIKAFNAMVDFIRDYKPEKILLMGDMFDMRPVSRHELHLPKKQEGQRLKEMYERGDSEFVQGIEDFRDTAELHWFDGNHEAWAYQLADKVPGLDGMIDPYNYLELKHRGFKFHRQGDIYKIDKLAFAHGDTLGTSLQTAAKNAVMRYGSSIRVWHWHTWQAYTREVLETKAYQTGVCVPCLCNRAPSYTFTPLNSWVHGFNYGEVEANGTFQDQTVIIWKNRFSVNGKHYGK